MKKRINTKELLQVIGLMSAAIVAVVILNRYQHSPSKDQTATVIKKTPTKSPTDNATDRTRGRKIEVTITKSTPGQYDSGGVTLAPLSGAEAVVLFDMAGNILHSWKMDAIRARLLPNCNILALHGTLWGKGVKPWSELRDSVVEYDWDGNTVWAYSSDDVIHHDVHRFENGNTIFLTRGHVPSPAYIKQKTVRYDRILEVSKSKSIVWSWDLKDHFDMRSCGARPCRKKLEPKAYNKPHRYDWSHSNTVSVIPENRHFRDGDKRFRPGNLLILSRNFWQAYIIDKETGKPVWFYPEGLTNVPLEGDRMVRGHESHMIPESYPGAGNILLFDNGMEGVRKSSIVREIDPISKETVWRYENGEQFFAMAASAAQRLSNGNTLISQDRGRGRIFEITPDKKIVWEAKLSHRPARATRYETGYCDKVQPL